MLSDAQTGKLVSWSRTTFGAYLDDWTDGLATVGRRPSTIAGYREKIGSYVKPALGDVELQALMPLDLDRLYTSMRRGGRRGGPLSLRTIRLTHTIIAKALHDAERKGLIQQNPARLASPPAQATTHAPEMAIWTTDELAAFLASTAGHHHAALFRLAAMTGLRRGEVCGLRWADVDLEAGTLVVRQNDHPGRR